MIVLTAVNRDPSTAYPGDTFKLIIGNESFGKVLIEETITVKKVIDFAASYRFAAEDGTVLGFHLAGIFGNSNELPTEIKNAVHVDDLTKEQRDNFIATAGIELTYT